MTIRDRFRALDPAIRALSQEIAMASDRQIIGIVALVDMMSARGTADNLLTLLRHRLALLKPPRPLRLPRLLFEPLKPLIVAPAQWRMGQPAIPRSAIMPIADHVRLTMGEGGAVIETRMLGRTTVDTDLITRLGGKLWPAAARILTDPAIPLNWRETELADAAYRPLADIVSAVLAGAAGLHMLRVESATGLLPPRQDIVETILSNVIATSPEALPIAMSLLLDSVPEAAGLLPPGRTRAKAAAMRSTIHEATDALLRRLCRQDAAETRIARATLADASAATARIATLLVHFADPSANPMRRAQLRDLRQLVDAACMQRFAVGLQHELLAPLRRFGTSAGTADVVALEVAARGLRTLGTEARALGNGPTYDRLLAEASAGIKDDAGQHQLPLMDRLRLVEILVGPHSALSMLERRR